MGCKIKDKLKLSILLPNVRESKAAQVIHSGLISAPVTCSYDHVRIVRNIASFYSVSLLRDQADNSQSQITSSLNLPQNLLKRIECGVIFPRQ